MDLLEIIIIAFVLLIISLVVLKLKKKNFSVEANKLVYYLGGKENIINIESNMSRLKVTLRNVEKVDKDAIQKLGATGIVEIDNQLKIILGKDNRQIKKYIKDLR